MKLSKGWMVFGLLVAGIGIPALALPVLGDLTLTVTPDVPVKGGDIVTLSLVGNITPRVEIPLQAVVSQQLRLQGSCAINGEFPEVLQLMDEGKINTDALLSAEAPLSEGADWFDRLYNKEKGLIKVFLIP